MSVVQLLASKQGMTTAKKLRQEEVHLSVKACWLVLFPPVKSNLEETESSSSPLAPLLPYFFLLLTVSSSWSEDAQAPGSETHREHLSLKKSLTKIRAH